ncbi:MAG TPA: preprotein translocase subunit SecE [Pirellulaceae bacterium]
MGPHGSRTAVMTKDNSGTGSGFMQVVQEFFKLEVYKRSQGRLVRQLTCLAVWVAFALIAWRLNRSLSIDWHAAPGVAYGVSGFILVAGLWLGYRLVNMSTFADFLIAVEAEMNKVSWPSRTELVRASIVVIVLMFGLTMVLFMYDVVLDQLLRAIGVVT